MNTVNKKRKTWPRLYDSSKKGKIKVWDIWVETMFGESLVKTSHGYENGKKIISSKEVSSGKNIGKSNETTAHQQAILDAASKWRRKCDDGMVEDKSKIGKKINYFPMLAQTYYHKDSPDVVIGRKKITTLSNKVLLQAKLNGVRCIVVKKNNKVKLYSRKGKEYTDICDVLVLHLSKLMSNKDIWDGELYVHGWSFQRIVQAVKRDKSKVWRKKVLFHCKKRQWEEAEWFVKTRNDTQLLQYHRYDAPQGVTHPNGTLKAKFRLTIMHDLPTSDLIKQVRTVELPILLGNSAQREIKWWHDKWVKEGYEGIIIRDPEAPYMWNTRDKCLLKYKEFFDEEFEIVGYREGTGTDKGAVIWLCRGQCEGRDIHFDVRPRGTIESRRLLFKRATKYIGEMLTVRFQERSMDGVPIFGVGIAIRNYE